ncbi:unnamed protein product [Lampetra planeri]
MSLGRAQVNHRGPGALLEPWSQTGSESQDSKAICNTIVIIVDIIYNIVSGNIYNLDIYSSSIYINVCSI